MTWIPLLSVRALNDFSAEEFKTHVRSLYFKKEKKQKTIRLKKQKPVFVIRLTKTGKVSLKVNRTPVWISREEIAQLAKDSGIEERLIWLRVCDKKKPIKISTMESEIDVQVK